MLTENFLRGRRRRQLSEREKQALEESIARVERYPARRTTYRRDELVRQSTLLLSGTMCRYMDDRSGHRQLVAYHIPGDFIDLHGFPLQRLDHDIATITAAEVALVPHERLTALTEELPHLARMLWFSTLLDAAMHREWIFRVGRLDAIGRIAHFLCETHARMAAIGRVGEDGTFEFPLTQQDIGEACGLTSVHVNRTLQRLRADGLIEIGAQQVRLFDPARLARIGEFSPDYLYLGDELRTP